MDEEFVTRLMYIVMAQLGVKIDFIQDDGTVNFSVPSMSDFMALSDNNLFLDNVPQGSQVAGELLLEMANNYFKENGLTPNGRIRSEYWTEGMGQTESMKTQQEMMGE